MLRRATIEGTLIFNTMFEDIFWKLKKHTHFFQHTGTMIFLVY